jgi:hypothetical protein
LVGVAVKVTEVEEQIVVSFAAIDTLALRYELTVTVTTPEVEAEHTPFVTIAI